MHIAYLTPEYPHPEVNNSAGIGTSIKNLATALVEKGHQVTLFIYGQEKYLRFQENKINFHLIYQKKYKLGGFYFYRKYLQEYINEHSEQIDIIEAPDWTGVTAFMKLRKPLVIRLHGSDTYFCHLENRPQKKKNFLFEKWALKNAKFIISVSEYTSKKTKELFELSSEIRVIHNIIDLDRFAPFESIVNNRYILNFGSIIRKKGVLVLAKAFNELAAQIPNVELIYLGKDVKDSLTGKLTSTLIKKEIDTVFQKNVHFVSQVPYDQVRQYVNDATVICLPSYAEAFPMTWLEAMSMEKALVTSSIGWAQEMMVHGETGFMVHPLDHKNMTYFMKEFLDDSSLRSLLGQNARKRVKEYFSTEVIVEQNIAYYKNICSL
ncbi:glycosyltransferase family 1 protein [Dokdonia sp. Dokd-P16]|uniref:glycosyltransferase family 4 protein n=1 Tax=Dokdonia sp. Dokd-P16 TaxID=2173169 RepID=UPI000D54A6CC|nr:glycosyltransferase family 4 protein [Dokdonia sp. Dokd-P16]AWH72868.1 glycosyltransferase family 1 protein [Dokdonia sp. Dokd-P16]